MTKGLKALESVKHYVSCNHPQGSVYLCDTPEYKQIERDLEVLEILKKQKTITEIKQDNNFGNYRISYSLNITINSLDFKQFNKIKEWLENERNVKNKEELKNE